MIKDKQLFKIAYYKRHGTMFGWNREYKSQKDKMNINDTFTGITVASNEVWIQNPPMWSNSLAPYSPQEIFEKDCSVPCAKPKGNNPMYVDNDKHIESSKINYLSDRASKVFYTKKDVFWKQFNLDNPKAPETPEALVEAITSGNYTIPPKAERCSFDRVTNQIVWRAPTFKADQAGYDAAIKALTVVFQDTKDTIAIGTPAEGLAAVKSLDAWSPTVTA